MNDPTLVRTRVLISYTGSDSYRAEFNARAGKNTAHPVTGRPIPPEEALLAGLDELARLTALFGFEDAAMKVFVDARLRVAQAKAARANRAP